MKRNISITKKGNTQNKLMLIFTDSIGIDPIAFATLFLTMNNMDEMDLHTKISLMVDLYTGRYKTELEQGIIKDVLEEFDIVVDGPIPMNIAVKEISTEDISIDMFK